MAFNINEIITHCTYTTLGNVTRKILVPNSLVFFPPLLTTVCQTTAEQFKYFLNIK